MTVSIDSYRFNFYLQIFKQFSAEERAAYIVQVNRLLIDYWFVVRLVINGYADCHYYRKLSYRKWKWNSIASSDGDSQCKVTVPTVQHSFQLFVASLNWNWSKTYHSVIILILFNNFHYIQISEQNNNSSFFSR